MDGRAILRLHETQDAGFRLNTVSPDVKHAKELVGPVCLTFLIVKIAPSGDSIWYGVHVVETMQRLYGAGAKSARAVKR